MKNPPMDAQSFAKWLNDKGSSQEFLKWQSGKTLRELWDTCECGDWLEWLLSVCNYQWPAPARAEYQRVMAPALAEYERVMAPARAEFQRVTAPAWAEFQRVKADTIRTIVPYPFK